jgi:hypothetical protein
MLHPSFPLKNFKLDIILLSISLMLKMEISQQALKVPVWNFSLHETLLIDMPLLFAVAICMSVRETCLPFF